MPFIEAANFLNFFLRAPSTIKEYLRSNCQVLNKAK